MSLKRAREDLAAVEAEIAEIERQISERSAVLSDVKLRAEKLRAAVEVLTGYEAPSSQEAVPAPPAMDPSSPYYGKSLAAAAVMVMRSEKQPLTASSIARIMKDGGWRFTSSNPPLALSWALRHHRDKTGELVTIPGQKWDFTEARPNSELVSKTAAGLQAARDRGVKLGAPRRMTEKMVDKMREMLGRGATNAEVAAALDVAEITVKRYRALDRHSESAGKDEAPDLGPNVHRLSR